MAAAQKVDGLGFWVGFADDEFVGWWNLQPAHGPDQPDDPGVADLGYRLLQNHWRKGLASEGARELLRYGFDDVGLDRIIAQTMTVNAGSRAVMERVGLSYVRSFPTSTTAPAEGVEEGEVEYEMTREQWGAPRPRGLGSGGEEHEEDGHGSHHDPDRGERQHETLADVRFAALPQRGLQLPIVQDPVDHGCQPGG